MDEQGKPRDDWTYQVALHLYAFAMLEHMARIRDHPAPRLDAPGIERCLFVRRRPSVTNARRERLALRVVLFVRGIVEVVEEASKGRVVTLLEKILDSTD